VARSLFLSAVVGEGSMLLLWSVADWHTRCVEGRRGERGGGGGGQEGEVPG